MRWGWGVGVGVEVGAGWGWGVGVRVGVGVRGLTLWLWGKGTTITSSFVDLMDWCTTQWHHITQLIFLSVSRKHKQQQTGASAAFSQIKYLLIISSSNSLLPTSWQEVASLWRPDKQHRHIRIPAHQVWSTVIIQRTQGAAETYTKNANPMIQFVFCIHILNIRYMMHLLPFKLTTADHECKHFVVLSDSASCWDVICPLWSEWRVHAVRGLRHSPWKIQSV